ncbi:MAG: hypothetical protein NC301_07560 [Bacteroides sp.]|nr:hypothetical protein [Bacteroides sp.]MCM1380061.1 hypothetical protein [Bacteroides sp.]MCM1446344.1 hypothetical protein [Prevotella sp.]
MSKSVKLRVPSAAVSPLLVEWLRYALPFDITVARGSRADKTRTVVFTVTDSTKSDAAAKLRALEQLIDAHNMRDNIEQ